MLVRNPMPSLASYQIVYHLPEGKMARVRGTSKGPFLEINPPENCLAAVFTGLDRGHIPHQSTRLLQGDVWKPFRPDDLAALLAPPVKPVEKECECEQECEECCKDAVVEEKTLENMKVVVKRGPGQRLEPKKEK